MNTDQNYVFNSTVILFLGLGSLIIFGLYAWWVTKREKKPFGEVMSVMAVHQNESIFVAIIILIYFAEAVVAASVHPPGEQPSPPLGRFASHIIISVIGTVASITLVKDIASIFEPNLDGLSRFIRILIVFAVGMFATFTPLANVTLIAAGLGEDLKFYLFCMDYFVLGVDDYDFKQMVAYYGGSPNYQSWSSMSYILKTSCVMGFFHMFIPFLEGLRNTASKERRTLLFKNPYKSEKDYEDEKKKAERAKRDAESGNSATEGEKRNSDKLEDNLSFLLRRMRYEPGEGMDPILKASKKALDGMSKTEDRIKMASRVGALVTEAKALDAEQLDKTERDQRKVALRKKIRHLFESPIKAEKVENRGFGVVLKGGSGN